MSTEDDWQGSIKIIVEFKIDEHGKMYSKHQPADSPSMEKLMGLSSGGMTQTAHALLVEAMKREVYLGYYSNGGKKELAPKVVSVLQKIIEKEVPHIVKNLNLGQKSS